MSVRSLARLPSPAVLEALGGLAATGFVMLALAVLRGMIRPWLFWGAEGFFCCGAFLFVQGLACLLARALRYRSAAVEPPGEAPAPAAEAQAPLPLHGPDVLRASVSADSLPGLGRAALDEARDLYGPDAELAVESTAYVATWGGPRGSFRGEVRVRCLNFDSLTLPGEDL